MDCQQCREIVSADLDREASVAEIQAAGRHVSWCRACRNWADDAEAVTRRIGIHAVDVDLPDLLERVLFAYDQGWSPHESDTTRLPDPVGSPPGPARHLTLITQRQTPPVPACGCAATCTCGCQQGRPCRCGQLAG